MGEALGQPVSGGAGPASIAAAPSARPGVEEEGESLRSIAGWMALAAAAYLAAAYLSRLVSLAPMQLPVFWLPTGVVVAVCAVQRSWRSAGAVIAALTAASAVWLWIVGKQAGTGVAAFAVATNCVVTAAQGLMAWAIMGRWAWAWRRQPATQPRPGLFRATALLLGVAGVGAAVIQGGVLAAVTSRELDLSNPHGGMFISVWITRAVADAIGVMLCTSPLLSLLGGWRPRWRAGGAGGMGGSGLEAVALGLLVFVISGLVYRAVPGGPGVALGLALLPLPVLVLVAKRLGPSAASLGGLCVAAAAATYTNAGTGPIAALGAGTIDRVIGLQAYLGLVVGTSLLLGAALADRQRNATALTSSEERNRKLFEMSPEGIVLVDPATQRVIEANEAFAQMLGRSAERLRGVPVAEFEAAESPEEVRAHVQRMERAGEDDFETRLRRADGRVIDVRVRARLIETGGVRLLQSLVQNISARREEVEARERERRLFLGGPVVVFRWRNAPGWPVEFVSRNVEQFGYAPEDFTSGRVVYGTIIHPEDADRVWRELSQMDASGAESGVQSYRLRTGDGRWIRLSDYQVLVRDGSGRVVAYEGYVMDDSARWEADQRLRQSQEQYRAITESMPALIYTYFVGSDGRREVRFVNSYLERWQRTFPWISLASDYRQTVLPNMHPDDVARYEAATSAARRQQSKFEIEYRALDADGAYRWIQAVITPFPAEGGTVWQALMLDVTDLRRSTQQLAETRDRLRATIEGAGIGTWSIDAVAGVLLPDPSLLRMLERPEVEGTRIPLEEYAAGVHPDDRARVVEALDIVMTGKGPYRAEYRIVLPSGRVRWLSSRGVFHRDEHSRVVRVVGACTDVTELKEAFAERERLTEQLHTAQKLESLGVMAGGIAHDFNNLLTGIIGHATLAVRHSPEGSEARRAADAIVHSARRAAELTQQMLAFAGRGRLEMGVVDMPALVQDVRTLLETSLAPGVEVVVQARPGVPAARGDATQLRQVVMNLFTNASDAMAESGGCIRVCIDTLAEPAPGEAWHGDGEVPPNAVCLEVTDSGGGMSAATVERLFEPFYTTKFAGRGLGLSAVRGIVRRHGGAIRFRSELGRGTTFRVYLPAAAGRPAAPVDRPETSPGAWTVMVVDDETLVRELAKASLEQAGFSVLTAGDGVAAIELAETHTGRIDAVLLDMTMPRLSGTEAFAELRRALGNVPVVMTSGYSEAAHTDEVLAQPRVTFLQKPYSPRQLIQAIRAGIESAAQGVQPAKNAAR